MTNVAELTRTPDDALRQGLAVVDLQSYDHQASQLMQEMASFAQGLDTGRPEHDDSTLPRRIMPGEPRDVRRMEMYGLRISGLLLPLTGIRPSEIIKGRFITYDEAGHETQDHTDEPMDDDHCMTIGVNVVGRGLLRTRSYTHTSSLGTPMRTPILLEPGSAIVQCNAKPVSHQVTSLSAGRIVAIWDYAS